MLDPCRRGIVGLLLLLLRHTSSAYVAPAHECARTRPRLVSRAVGCVAVDTDTAAAAAETVAAAAPLPTSRQPRQRLTSSLEPVNFSPFVALRAAFSSNSFGEFMSRMRSEQGDAVMLNLWPVAPTTYVLMGKQANRDVLAELDPSLEQILQELINVLPVSARVPSEVDVDLQKKVATFFQSERVVNERLPSFEQNARRMQERWAALPAGSTLDIFCELSE